MTSNQEQKDNYDPNFIEIVFNQLSENIRKEDDLVQGWVKYYLTIQAGLVVSLGFIGRFNQTANIFINAASIAIPVLGIVTVYFITNLIHREQFWQGRYNWRLKQIKE